MKKKIVLCVLLVLFVAGAVFAQVKLDDEDKSPKINTKKEFNFRHNQSGDWFLRLNINAAPPIGISRDYYGDFFKDKLKFGMDLNFSAYYFITHWFAVGGNIGFGFNPTIGSKVFYAIPILAEASFHFEIGNFEIPIFLGIGGAFEHHANNFLFGLAMKPETGLFYRINSDWSVGATFGVSLFPQWYTNPEYNCWGYIINAGVSARYHM